MESSGSTCSISSAPRRGSNRGSLTSVIIEEITASNTPPTWNTSPVNELAAITGVLYQSTLTDDVSDPDTDPLTFARISGPNWLNVDSGGILSGTPGEEDGGPQSWVVSVSDGIASPVEVTLNITVQPDNDGDGDGDGDPDTTDPDDDNDGIPDAWEIAHALDPQADDRNANLDNDLFDNWNENLFDTDPQDRNSIQSFTVDLDPRTGDATIRFSSSANRRYAVEYSSSLTLGSWQDLAPASHGTGSEVSIADRAEKSKCFYRLRVELP